MSIIVHPPQAQFDLYSEPGDRPRRLGDSEVGWHHSAPSDTELHSALAEVPKRGDKKKRLLRAYVQAGFHGLIDHEAVAKTGLPMSSITSVRGSLRERGWVTDSGRRRPSPFGNPNIIWTVTSAGRRQVK